MGWIKLDRQILDNELWLYEPFSRGQAWVDLLLMASHDDESFINKKGICTKLKRGQLVTSVQRLSKRWKWSRGKVDRFLGLLIDLDMIHRDGTPNGTTLTIVNYGKFQNRRATYGATNESTYGATDEATGGALTRSKRNKEDKNVPSSFSNLSYAEERARQFALLEEWANKEESDE